MKTTNSLIITIILGLMVSCAGSEQGTSPSVELETVTPIETVYTFTESADGEPMARMLISGMSCEQMCGSRIKAAVAAIPGVSDTELHFHAESEVDTLTVRFDPTLVKGQNMVDAVKGIQGGNYQVKEVLMNKEAKTSYQPTREHKHQQVSKQVAKASPDRLSIPSIFDVLRRVSSI